MTAGMDSYVTPVISSTAGLLETTLTADMPAALNIGTPTVPLMAMTETFNGLIPGPTFKLIKDDTVIVRFINNLDHPCGIHWHGIELENYSDGTPFTQDAVDVSGLTTPMAGITPGRSTYLYKFKVPRPGIYWYHPHHHHSTNQVFKGMYGMIVVADPNDNDLGLRASGAALPPTGNTLQLVLSDVTVCYSPYPTYSSTLPWAGNAGGLPPLPAQTGPPPAALCSTSPIDDEGMSRPPFLDSEIPNIQHATGAQTNEGQLVLTNGMNVGGRVWPAGAPAGDAQLYDVQPGQGLRLQIVNSATVRYFRLRLTNDAGTLENLVRVGGEGDLLDHAVVEGGHSIPSIDGTGNYDTKYDQGEILLPPGSRADVVVTIPIGASGTWTLWTEDFQQRAANAYSNVPTVPVMHLNVTGAALAIPYSIIAGDPVLTSVGASVDSLGPPPPPPSLATLLDPTTFSAPKIGNPSPNMVISASGGVATFDGFPGPMTEVVPYYNSPHVGDTIGTLTPKRSSRFAAVGLDNILELTVENSTDRHHPYHPHGLSMQPKDLKRTGFPTYTWPYNEFRDNIDIPANYTLRYRIKITDRPLADGLTTGGAFGRWMFHCHIFFHHHAGMMSELVMCAANGHEKPNVNVVGSWAYASLGGTAQRHGTFAVNPVDATAGVTVTSLLAHLEGLTTPFGTLTPTAPGTSSGTWNWSLTTATPTDEYVYITATDSDGLQDQAVFRVQIFSTDGGSDTGDPHIATVDGKYYDFQAAGEFTLLRDPEAFEIQVRQTPVPTATPVTDPNSGLTSCVSINTAVAVRTGAHTISYQPHPESHVRLALFVDGKLAQLPLQGRDLGSAHVIAIPAGDGSTAIQLTDGSGAVITITPWFWTSYNVWLLNVSVANTIADVGIMGRIPNGTWLPALPTGATVGPKPASLNKRYVALYRTFANSWRVTDRTSLFIYAPGTSTETFTDTNWPARKPPCKLKPQFQIPGAKPSLVNIKLETAEQLCRPVTVPDLHRNCVFDVATTGDKTLVKSYLLAQDLRLNGTTVQIVGDKDRTRLGESVLFTATASAMTSGRPTPTGSIRFVIDGVAAGKPVRLNAQGRASLKTESLSAGKHQIRAVYSPGGKNSFYWASTSPNLLHTVGKKAGKKR